VRSTCALPVDPPCQMPRDGFGVVGFILLCAPFVISSQAVTRKTPR
jgi:hypothetical protein